MSRKQTIIQGTIILTITGFLSRLMGFFYRIFLSRTFGEEGVGLYQLIFPVYALCFSLTTAGIETAISRTVARKISLGEQKEAREILFSGLFFSFLLSCTCTFLLQKNTTFIANVLHNAFCVDPQLHLRILLWAEADKDSRRFSAYGTDSTHCLCLCFLSCTDK